MERNVGERDKLLRTILGIYAMLLGFLFIQGIVGTILGVLGAVSLITGLVGWCGIYTLLGISTATEESSQTNLHDAAQDEVAQSQGMESADPPELRPNVMTAQALGESYEPGAAPEEAPATIELPEAAAASTDQRESSESEVDA